MVLTSLPIATGLTFNYTKFWVLRWTFLKAGRLASLNWKRTETVWAFETGAPSVNTLLLDVSDPVAAGTSTRGFGVC